MALAMLALLAAMGAGLVRLGWGWPPLGPALPAAHGPLMVSGFLGTLIGVERAVALSTSLSQRSGPQRPRPPSGKTSLARRWTYVGPLLTGLGALALIIGWPGLLGSLLMTLGSGGLVVVFGLILRLQFALFTMTMALGALFWLIGNVLWLAGWPVYSAVLWWAGFLMLTIAGERLELNRVLRLSGYVQKIFLLAITFFLIGLVITIFNFDLGVRLAGAGMIALALWLLRYDIAGIRCARRD